jgi:hypothetical protein
MFSPLNSCSIKYLEEGRMTQLCGRGRGRQERGGREREGSRVLGREKEQVYITKSICDMYL